MPVLAFALLFALCVIGAWAWFNTDVGRGNQKPEINNQQSLVSC
jgi:hypothetical protein